LAPLAPAAKSPAIVPAPAGVVDENDYVTFLAPAADRSKLASERGDSTQTYAFKATSEPPTANQVEADAKRGGLANAIQPEMDTKFSILRPQSDRQESDHRPGVAPGAGSNKSSLATQPLPAPSGPTEVRVFRELSELEGRENRA